MAELAQGTEIFFLDPTTTPTVTKITCPKTIDPGQPSSDEHDITGLCSMAKQKFTGLTDWGSATITIDYDQSDITHRRLIELSEEMPRKSIELAIGLPALDKGNPAPTWDATSNKWELSTDRGWRTFQGQIKSFAVTFEAGNLMPGTIEIAINKREKTLFKGRT